MTNISYALLFCIIQAGYVSDVAVVSFLYLSYQKCQNHKSKSLRSVVLFVCSCYVWEIMHSSIKKMNKHVQKLYKEVDEAKDRLEAAERRVRMLPAVILACEHICLFRNPCLLNTLIKLSAKGSHHTKKVNFHKVITAFYRFIGPF